MILRLPRVAAVVSLLSLALVLAPQRGAAQAPRVKRAAERRMKDVKQLLATQKLSFPPREVFLRVLKRERVLELWGRAGAGPFKLLKSYPVCSASGELGPKRKEGDLQVPEGFYVIDLFNPTSTYYLSLRVSYPNAADRVHGVRGKLGGDIFIHGKCVSIGCVAITDGPIEEVYLIAAAARRPIPVHIFPARLDATGMKQLREDFAARPELLAFWAELQPGFAHFEQHRTLPRVRVDARGRYVVAPAAGTAPAR